MRKKLLILSLITVALLCSASTFVYFKILTFNDISIEAIYPISNPDFGKEQTKNRPGVYLVSYADKGSVYFKNQNALVLSALNKGIDFFLNYRRSCLSTEFIADNKEILNQKFGAGLWLWKPWIILDAMKKAPEGAIIIYSDGGLIFSGVSAIPIINYAKKHDINLIQYNKEDYGTLGSITKREVLINMGCDNEECRKSPSIWAAFIVLRNTEKSRDFVKDWLERCKNKENLTGEIIDPDTGRAIVLAQHPEFHIHKHDEAVISSIASSQKHEINLIPDEELLKYTTWHHRKGNRESYSLIPYMKKLITKVEKRALNLQFVRDLRQKLLKTHSIAFVQSENRD